ncbi:MAG: pyridoxal phosphate-dependent aminotransferase [Elusimicrobiota bacterium]|jgi:cystathionine beta-lyase|nr:pyridoxal phosphate-dependent aminotransferase [Elusimicrobiota bacterium]
MKYNFDKKINRKNTNSEKFDFAADFGKSDGLLPMWIADMDFEVLPQITQAIKKRASHAVYGYTEPKDDYFEAVISWFGNRFNFDIKKEWIVKNPGVISAICCAVRAFTNPSDAVLIQPPVYYPFARSVILNKRKLVNNPLVYADGRYFIDFEDFERKIVENKVKLFIFCSPHNPVGRVWTKDEVKRICEICFKHKTIIFSDEIHCDFILPPHKHTIAATISPKYLPLIITATAPSKTFNIAGLIVSNIIIQNEKLRKLFVKERYASGLNMVNAFGIVAAKAAYTYGGSWVDQLNSYIRSNFDYAEGFIKKHMPQIKFIKPEGTYLLWLDCHGLKLGKKDLIELIENKAKLWVDEGEIFGIEGSGFIRLNLACPAATVKKALKQLKTAIDSISDR